MSYPIFLSYRRDDTSGHAGRIREDLRRYFGTDVVFRDIDAISAGSDFVVTVASAIAGARVVLVLIGNTWVSERSSDGTRRLDAPGDYVRRELELALQAPGVTVLPVLVEGASMPALDVLPASLQRLARLQALELTEQRWEYDFQRLAGALAAAGVPRAGHRGIARRTIVACGLLLSALLAGALWSQHDPAAPVDAWLGLWFLPNGSFWTIRHGDEGLWIEETHYESGAVWKRGPGRLATADELSVELAPVFDTVPYRYVHTLHLASDRQSLIGSVRRSDTTATDSVVLTRARR